MNAVVLGGQARQALSIVRSLGRAGLSVAVAETTSHSLAGWSKYCAARYQYAAPERDRELFIQDVLQLVSKQDFDVVIPAGPRTTQFVAEEQDRIGRHARLLLPKKEVYSIARDKAKTALFAAAVGVAAPKTVWPNTREELLKARDTLAYPLLVKPRDSSGSVGMELVERPDLLEQTYDTVATCFPQPIIQEYIPSAEPVYDMSFLIDNAGQIILMFQSKRIRMYPVDGGPMTCWESIRDPGLEEIGRYILGKLDWRGVLHMEFKRHSQTGEFFLIEMNPRFWGAVELAVACGLDFPYLYYRLAMRESLAPIHEPYPVGRRGRWVVPGELRHMLDPKRQMTWREFFDFSDSSVVDSVISRDDPAPLLGYVLGVMRRRLSPARWLRPRGGKGLLDSRG
jgi:predicted ATP-grasp superfamily ATP-dependent carboligase